MTTEPTTAPRAVIYARISLDRKEEAGVKRQEKACRDLAASRGYVVTDTYIDNSVSAYSGATRPEYQRLLRDIKAGRVDKVLAWHQDRLHRRLTELNEYIDVVAPRGVDTETVNGGAIDLSGSNGRMIAQIIGAVSEQESRHKSERIKAAFEQMNLNGVPYATGRRTFGYNPERTALVEPEAEALRHVAGMVIGGGSLYGAAQWLNEQGFTTTTGKPFYGGAVRDLLTNPRLAGYATHNTLDTQGKRRKYNRKVVGRGQWPVIFTEGEHEQLKAVLTNPARTANKGRGHKPEHLGSGIYRCGCSACLAEPDNARVMYARWRKDTLASGAVYKKRVYYAKSNENLTSKGHTSRLADPVDDYVTAAVLARLSRPDMAEAIAAAEGDDAAAVLTTKRTQLRDRIAGLEAEFMAGNLDAAQFGKLNKALLTQLADLDAELATRANDNAAVAAITTAGDDVRVWWATAPLELKRALVDAVARVYIVPERTGVKRFDPDKVRIEWKV
ncbi:recombinase family protein [Corynebacterium senegalense]|uniref:recombinase family protein n=1 Tax=Corynebacterium senegalense TaxID=2080750 RepID=UPI000E1FDBC1|nr:recombinase family protein [Corynebacterium senegalense]